MKMADINLLVLGVLLCIVVHNIGTYTRQSAPSVVETVSSVYDYVIVGGGSAGCVLAARLSEDENVSVLLLEAGGEETNNPAMSMPYTASDLLGTTATANEYTLPQKNACLSFQENKCYLPRGRVLGGGGSVNCMQYVRGNREDFDGWAEMGCDGWSYAEVLPYFIKLENMQIAAHRSSSFHGTEGPISIVTSGHTAVGQAFVKSGLELGYKENDYNGDSQEGFSLGHWNMRNGERWGSVKSHLRPAMNRRNLHVASHAFVTKVLFEKKRAIGVSFVKNDVKQAVAARKEVILSAGAIATPKLLMLSGIGPKNHLERFNISVLADLPVGENHQDHILTDAVTGVVDVGGAVNANTYTNWLENVKYYLFGTGKLTLACLCDGIGFARTPRQPKDKITPFIEFMGVAKTPATSPEQKRKAIKNSNYKENIFNDLNIGEDTIGDGFSLKTMLTRPFSRGSVQLTSSDPYEQAAIDANYLSDPRDVDIMIDGIRIAQELVDTDPFKDIGYKPIKRHHPGCKPYKYDSEDYWACYVRHNSFTIYHSSGTCRMGAANDSKAVVDPSLRVRGLDALRVVDASVMPTVTAGNTNAPTMMIAERAADIIRGRITFKPINIKE